MRRNAIYILTLSFVLFGCYQKPVHPMLQKAERLMQSRPDSALAILGRYTTRSFSDSADIAAYALLRTQADDKNYIDHTSDSLIKIAVRYYDRHGSKLQQAQAHYTIGAEYFRTEGTIYIRPSSFSLHLHLPKAFQMTICFPIYITIWDAYYGRTTC